MSRRARFRVAILCCLLPLAVAAENPEQNLDQQFKAAVTNYDAGRFQEAAAQLEKLLPRAANSFEAHELLGLTYASLEDDRKAIPQLETAVRLKPDSAAARTNLAASLFHAGKNELAGREFQKALQLEPQDYSANHNLGEFYVHGGQLAQAQPLLERAQQIRPDAYDNGYDLAMADLEIGRLAAAHQTIESLLTQKNTGELHNLLGQIDEQQGNYVAAVNEYETATHLDPSDDNLFAWGSELLLHRTYEPAVEVFRAGTGRFPRSARLQIGLGMALYARGLYEDAVKALLAAADLNPADPRCYAFLARAYDSSPKEADEVIATFRRYAELQPQNARAQYYYAMSLWKGKQLADGSFDAKTVESLLKKSIALDGSLPEAHMQLGNLYADQHDYQASIPEYERAIQLDPKLADAHYRLAIDYVRSGQKDMAQKEFAVYQELRTAHMAEDDKERAEVRQFIVAARTDGSGHP